MTPSFRRSESCQPNQTAAGDLSLRRFFKRILKAAGKTAAAQSKKRNLLKEGERRLEFPKELLPFLDSDGRLTALSGKRKKKLAALFYLAGFFEAEKQYTERQVNALLDEHTAFHDPATLRRELYEFHFLDRKKDGSFYWLMQLQPSTESE